MLPAALRAGRVDQQVGADGALEGCGGLRQCDGVDGAPVGGDVAGAQAEFVGELHQRVLDADVVLLGLHTVQPGGVGDLAQPVQLGLDLLERGEAALETGLVRHGLGGLVEGVGGIVGGGARLLDDRVVLLALEQRGGGAVPLVEQGVAVGKRGANEFRGVLRVLGFLPGGERTVDPQPAEDQGEQHGDQQNGVQPGGHPPVARGVLTATDRRLRDRVLGRIGSRYATARRRGEVAPPRFRRLGARLASPHSTNNLSAPARACCAVSSGPYYSVVQRISARQAGAFQTLRKEREGP